MNLGANSIGEKGCYYLSKVRWAHLKGLQVSMVDSIKVITRWGAEAADGLRGWTGTIHITSILVCSLRSRQHWDKGEGVRGAEQGKRREGWVDEHK